MKTSPLSLRHNPRWYRCTYQVQPFGKPLDYRFGTLVCVTEHWLEEAMRSNDCVETRDIAAKVRAVKVPPAEWLELARQRALYASTEALGNANFLRTELTRHYPGHR